MFLLHLSLSLIYPTYSLPSIPFIYIAYCTVFLPQPHRLTWSIFSTRFNFLPGRHTIDLLYDGVPVPGSPFTVNVRRGCDPNKCRAFGPGLDHGLVNQVNTFTVETKGKEVLLSCPQWGMMSYVLCLDEMIIIIVLCRSWYWWSWSGCGRTIRGQDDV